MPVSSEYKGVYQLQRPIAYIPIFTGVLNVYLLLTHCYFKSVYK